MSTVVEITLKSTRFYLTNVWKRCSKWRYTKTMHNFCINIFAYSADSVGVSMKWFKNDSFRMSFDSMVFNHLVQILMNSNHSNWGSSEIEFKFDDWMKFNWMSHLTESVRNIWNSKVMVQTNWNGKIETCNRHLVTV